MHFSILHTMTDTCARFLWRVGENNVHHEVQLRGGKLAVSAYYLQSLLPLSCKLLAVQAIVSGDAATKISIPSHWDLDENELFMIDSTLSLSYELVHSESCMYVSDSEMDNLQDSFQTPPIQNPTTKGDCGIEKGTTETVYLDNNSDDSDTRQKKNIVPWILESSGSRRLKNLLVLCEGPKQVNELPQVYNGNVCFELPPTLGRLKKMEGMEQRLDGHLWTRPAQTNMAINCTVRLSYCLGYLQCYRKTCPYYLIDKRFNDFSFHGHLDRQVSKGYSATDENSAITCHYCQKVVTCIATCDSKIYYVLPKDVNMTRLVIHYGEHSHNVQAGTSRAAIEKVRRLVSTVLKIDKGGPRKVQMLVARQMLFDSLVLEDGRVTGETELHNFLEELMPLVQNKGYVICMTTLFSKVICLHIMKFVLVLISAFMNVGSRTLYQGKRPSKEL